MQDDRATPKGTLAEVAGKSFPLQVCRSATGYYIGTRDDKGAPYSRESRESWDQEAEAQIALERGLWTQKPRP